jgi:hypothetical protein
MMHRARGSEKFFSVIREESTGVGEFGNRKNIGDVSKKRFWCVIREDFLSSGENF